MRVKFYACTHDRMECAHVHCLFFYYHVDILFCRCDLCDTLFCVGECYIGNTNASLGMPCKNSRYVWYIASQSMKNNDRRQWSVGIFLSSQSTLFHSVISNGLIWFIGVFTRRKIE